MGLSGCGNSTVKLFSNALFNKPKTETNPYKTAEFNWLVKFEYQLSTKLIDLNQSN